MSGKRVLITGAASGIGRAVALSLAGEGNQLVLLDRNEGGLEQLATELHCECAITVGSVADGEVCRNAVNVAVRKFGGLDGLSHNAGIQRYGDVVSTSVELWQEVISINLTGGFLAAKAAMPELRKSRGAAVFTASVQGMAAQKGALAYVAAKHGLVGLVSAMAVDEAALGVRINGVAPGSVDTPMLRNAIELDPHPLRLEAAIDRMHPMGRRAQATEVAQVIAFLLSERASFITGEVVRVDGGLLSQIPGAPDAA